MIFTYECALCLLACAAILCFYLGSKLHFLPALALFWAVVSGLRVFMLPQSPWGSFGPEWSLLFDQAAANSLAQLLLIVGAVFALSLPAWLTAWRAVAVLNAVWIIVGSFYHAPYGVLLNASMSGCFAAALLPIAGSLPSFFLGITAVFLTEQSLPMAMFFILVGTCLLSRRKWAWIALSLFSALSLGRLIAGSDLFSGRGRYLLWETAWQWWTKNANPLIGTGAGSVTVIGPQITRNFPHDVFLWLHSEPLQVLFEQGAIGLALILSLYALSLYKSRGAVFYALIGYGAWSLANYPLRMPLSALYGAFLIRLAFSGQARLALLIEHRLAASFQDLQRRSVRWRHQFSEAYKLGSQSLWIWSLIQSQRTRLRRNPKCQAGQSLFDR